jgi:uncharacterized membrane protein YebE (DUF533 family)
MKMKLKTRLITLLTIVTLISSTSTVFADDNAFRETFRSAFYGGAAGALVGAALMVFTKKPADHLDYIAYGAAGGVIAGTVYGVAKTSRSLAEYENGKVKFAVPAIVPDLTENPNTRQTSVTWRTSLFSGTFN